MAHQQRAAHLEHLGLRPLRPGERAAAAGRFARLAGQPGVRRKDRRHHRAGPDVVSALHDRPHRVADRPGVRPAAAGAGRRAGD